MWSIVFNVLLVILVIMAIALGVLYFFGRKLEKKQVEQQQMLEAAKQTVSMLIVDKKKMKIKDAVEAGLPKQVLEQTPSYMRWAKLPVVKAKIGPRIMTMMCDTQIYDLIPVKKEVKATVSGIYITGVRGIRGSLETPQKKKGFFARLRNK